jgi:hypothetical protein
MQKKPLSKAKCVWFYLCWLFIGFVSSVDIYLTIKYSDNLPEFELNPIARLILHCDKWDVSRFVAIKVFMTILVLGIVRWILYINPKNAFIIINVIALGQLALLIFLLYGWYY